MIGGGFRTAGIFPSTPAAFDYSKLATNISTMSATKASDLVGSQSPGSPSAKTNVTVPVSASPSTTSTGYTAIPNYCDDSLSTTNTGSSSTNGSMLFDDLTSLKKGLERSERDKFRHGIKPMMCEERTPTFTGKICSLNLVVVSILTKAVLLKEPVPVCVLGLVIVAV